VTESRRQAIIDTGVADKISQVREPARPLKNVGLSYFSFYFFTFVAEWTDSSDYANTRTEADLTPDPTS
jgi:hypothetical protein